jgi:hypothetical protein
MEWHYDKATLTWEEAGIMALEMPVTPSAALLVEPVVPFPVGDREAV